eukprot:497549_1
MIPFISVLIWLHLSVMFAQRDANYFRELDFQNLRDNYIHDELLCNVPKSTNSFNMTNTFDGLKYYTMEITALGITLPASSVYLTTCCNRPDIFYQDEYCDKASLDTVIYVLEGKVINAWPFYAQFSLIETSIPQNVNNDSLCNDTRKSFINLENYIPGSYFVAIGGKNQTETGKFVIDKSCNYNFNHSYRGITDSEYMHQWFQYQYELGFLDPFRVQMQRITCGEQLFSTTTINHPIRYYEFNLTNEIIEKYSTRILVSTCCTDKVCESCIQEGGIFSVTSVNEQCESAYAEGINERCIKASTSIGSYYDYCYKGDNYEKLDAILYVLRKRNGSIELLDTSTDYSGHIYPNCAGEFADYGTYINLMDYDTEQYIFAIGGTYSYDDLFGNGGWQNYGLYAFQATCEQYGYPMSQSEFNP